MENRIKKRILIGVLIVLILANVASLLTLGYKKYWYQRNRKHCHKEMNECKNPQDRLKHYIQRELQLDQHQFGKFCGLKDYNISKTNEIMDSLSHFRAATQEEIIKENPDSLKLLELADSIGLYHKKMQIEMNRHFLATKKILKPEQVSKFNEMMINLNKKHNRNTSNK